MGRLGVLFVTPWYPTEAQPAAGVFVREHAQAVRRHGDCDVVVVHGPSIRASSSRRWSLTEERDASLTGGIPTFRLTHRRLPLPRSGFASYVWSVARAYRAIVADGFAPDLIHAHIYSVGVAGVLVGRRHRTPVVVTEQSSNFPLRVLSRTEVVAARLAFRGAARVMPVSRSLQRAIEAYGIRARFRVVPNAVDPSIFHPGEGAAPAGRLLCVALLRPVKGVDDLLHALADPALSRDDWHLDVVGDGPHRAVCERLADRLGLRPRVTFHGYQPKATVADFMRRSDALVLPSRSENMPCVALEALTTGLPVIATKVGGVPEIVDDASGVLAPPGDAAALARAVTHFLDHRDEFDRASIARQATERFSLQTVGAALGDVYREVLA